MTKWFCGDWHLGHIKPFVWEARGFTSVEDMNKELIHRHNSRVSPEDEVYVLGDLCLGSSLTMEERKEMIESFNGKLHIIRGNHDTDAKIEMYKTCKNVVSIHDFAIMIKLKGKRQALLSHFPSLVGTHHPELLNIYAHTHQSTFISPEVPQGYCVSMDATKCYPVSEDEILGVYREMVKNK